MLILILRLWSHLNKQRKAEFFMMAFVTIVSAFAEILSLGAVVPFISIIFTPENIFSSSNFSIIFDYFGLVEKDDKILLLTISFVLISICAASLRMFLLWGNTRLAFAAGSDISNAVYERTLYQPYSVHISRNSSEVSSSLDYKVGYTVGVLLQLLTLISSSILLLAVIFALIVINPVITLVTIFGFFVFYGLISIFFKNKLSENSKIIASESTLVIKAVQEALGGIRDVLLDGMQPFYAAIYKQSESRLKRAMGNNIFISGSPRFIMEAVAISLISIVAYELSKQDGAIKTALPMLAAFTLGAQRLLPSVQQSYSSWAGIVSSYDAVLETVNFLDQPMPINSLDDHRTINFDKKIEFKNVSFKYENGAENILNNVNLKFLKGSKIGIVGISGSGKSTLIDLLMGLIDPSAGQLLVDDVTISTNNKRAWQNLIAHVPQSIYLADATLAENIAFGVPVSQIDLEKVRDAAKHAKISDFIESSDFGYSTKVGERGVKLSGGQRQRIGIARALYKNASILIFDEATSALDNLTEEEVMESINLLGGNLTIIIVAHRLSTIRKCDLIVELTHEKIVVRGNYDE